MVTNDPQSTAPSTASTAGGHAPPEEGSSAFPWEQLGQAYGITWTATELELLSTDPEMLDPIERQRAYLLKLALRNEECPACRYVLCPRSAWQGEYDPGRTGDGPGYACPNCGVRLVHRQGLALSEHWFDIEPGQTVHIEHHRGGGAPK